MKERPILFNAAMVRAILSGQKTQTRRVVKPDLIQSDSAPLETGSGLFYFWCSGKHSCPHGNIGERLWVRETWAPVSRDEHPAPMDECIIEYRADKPNASRAGGWECEPDDPDAIRWRPSIHMPRWASRITLEITGVRVERLQDISRGDAMAEGCPFPNMAKGSDPREWFAEVWNSTGGDWSANPLVWVIEFKRIVTSEKN